MPFSRKTLVGASNLTVDVGPVLLHGDNHQSFMEENRGLTGTSYAAAQLAFALRRAFPSWAINLITVGGSVLGENQDLNLRIDNLAQFRSRADILIGPSETLCQLSPRQTLDPRVVVICQHPRDLDLVRVRVLHVPMMEIHVSAYSFWQNFSPFARSYYLPNPLWLGQPQRAVSGNLPGPRPIIGFLGSLVPEKGFLHVARAWPEIKRLIPDAQLEVIGGSSLYGIGESHPIIPTTMEYGEKILKALGPGCRLEDLGITFFGRVDAAKTSITDRWDFAIVNPTGYTESFCYSLRELMARATPTFFGAREGLREFATDFPELALKHPRDLARKVVELSQSGRHVDGLRVRLEDRARRDAHAFESLIDGFFELLQMASENRSARLRLEATRSWPPLSGWVVAELWTNSAFSVFLRKKVLDVLARIAAYTGRRLSGPQ